MVSKPKPDPQSPTEKIKAGYGNKRKREAAAVTEQRTKAAKKAGAPQPKKER